MRSGKPHEKQNKKHQNARYIDKKLKSKSLMLFVSFFSCDLQDFKFWYVNCKVFDESFFLLSWLHPNYRVPKKLKSHILFK